MLFTSVISSSLRQLGLARRLHTVSFVAVVQLLPDFMMMRAPSTQVHRGHSTTESLPPVHRLHGRHPGQRTPTAPFLFPAPRFPIYRPEVPNSSGSWLSTSDPLLPAEQPRSFRAQPVVADNREAPHKRYVPAAL